MARRIQPGKLLVACLLLAAGSAFGSGPSGAEEAERLVTAYLDATRQGDVMAMADCLGGELAQRRRPLLENPAYPEDLIETYQNASFEILPPATTGTRLTVDVVVHLDGDEELRRRYVLGHDPATGDLRILDLINLAR